MSMFCEDFGPPVSFDTLDHDGAMEEARNRAADMMDAGGLAAIQFAAEGLADAAASRMIEEQCECESAEYTYDGRQIAAANTCTHHGDAYFAIHERLSALALRRICRRGSIFSGLGRPALERLAVEMDAALAVTP